MKEKNNKKTKKKNENENENINIRIYSGKIISLPKFYDEEISEEQNEGKNKEKNKKVNEKLKKEEIIYGEKYKIDTTKIFSSFLDIYKYLEEVSNFINLNLKYFDEKLLRKTVQIEKIDKIDIEKLNKKYKNFSNKAYEKLEKVEIYLNLRRYLNISNKNVFKNNKKISEDILVLKREIFEFAKKILKIKEDLDEKDLEKMKKDKDRVNKEKEKLKDNKTANKTNQKILNEKINIFNKNINELKHLKKLKKIDNENKNKSKNKSENKSENKEENSKESNEEKFKNLLKENALIYISIYKIFALDENLFYKNFGKDKYISLEDIKDIVGKVFSFENLKEFNYIKNKINENIKDLNKEQIKAKEVELVKEKEKKQSLANESEEIVKNVSKYFEKDFGLKMQNIFNNNQIDFFRSKDKMPANTTIGLDKGYILLQNTKTKVDLFTLAHELGHLLRYTYVKKDSAVNFIEESFAISFEFLLLDILLNDEKLKFKFEDQINDAVLNFLSKTFDTLECFLFQESVLKEIKQSNSNELDEESKDDEILKNVVLKRKEILKKMEHKDLEINVYDFALNYSYLKPYYSLNYFFGIFIGFELFCKFKENSNSENFNSKNLEFFKNKKLDLKNVLNFLGKEKIEDLIDIQKLFKYFKKILTVLNNKV